MSVRTPTGKDAVKIGNNCQKIDANYKNRKIFHKKEIEELNNSVNRSGERSSAMNRSWLQL